VAEDSWPSPTHSSGAVSDSEYEVLAGAGLPSGILYDSPTDTSVIFADGTGGLVVKVRAGKYATVRGRSWYSGSTDTSVAIGANASGNPRIDLVVLELDRATWNVRVDVVQGTAAATPVAPSTTNSVSTSTGVWQLPLAEVTVANGASSLAAQTVKNRAWHLGQDGQIRTYDAQNRPPHLRGRRIHEHTTNSDYVSSGTDWVLTRSDTGWLTLTPASGWSSVYTKYRRTNGFVTAQLVVQRTGGTLAAGTNALIATLPSGYRPTVEMPANGNIWGSSTVVYPAALHLTTDGQITLTDYTGSISAGKNMWVNTFHFPI
jgi:hypothetical protein